MNFIDKGTDSLIINFLEKSLDIDLEKARKPIDKTKNHLEQRTIKTKHGTHTRMVWVKNEDAKTEKTTKKQFAEDAFVVKNPNGKDVELPKQLKPLWDYFKKLDKEYAVTELHACLDEENAFEAYVEDKNGVVSCFTITHDATTKYAPLKIECSRQNSEGDTKDVFRRSYSTPSGIESEIENELKFHANSESDIQQFTTQDWYGLAGADHFPDGSQPLICRKTVGDVYYEVVAAASGMQIGAYVDDDWKKENNFNSVDYAGTKDYEDAGELRANDAIYYFYHETAGWRTQDDAMDAMKEVQARLLNGEDIFKIQERFGKKDTSELKYLEGKEFKEQFLKVFTPIANRLGCEIVWGGEGVYLYGPEGAEYTIAISYDTFEKGEPEDPNAPARFMFQISDWKDETSYEIYDYEPGADISMTPEEMEEWLSKFIKEHPDGYIYPERDCPDYDEVEENLEKLFFPIMSGKWSDYIRVQRGGNLGEFVISTIGKDGKSLTEYYVGPNTSEDDAWDGLYAWTPYANISSRGDDRDTTFGLTAKEVSQQVLDAINKEMTEYYESRSNNPYNIKEITNDDLRKLGWTPTPKFKDGSSALISKFSYNGKDYIGVVDGKYLEIFDVKNTDAEEGKVFIEVRLPDQETAKRWLNKEIETFIKELGSNSELEYDPNADEIERDRIERREDTNDEWDYEEDYEPWRNSYMSAEHKPKEISANMKSAIINDLSDFFKSDYQNRRGGYPSANIADSVQLDGEYITADFKNTDMATCRKWLARALRNRGYEVSDSDVSVFVGDDSEFENDWNTATIHISLLKPPFKEPAKKTKQPLNPVKYFKGTQATKDKVNAIHKQLKSNEAFLAKCKENGISWPEHSHKGINLMRAKMAAAYAVQNGHWE